MILTVKLNPLLEIRLHYHQINLGENHRDPLQRFAVGGKGINVSRQLNCLNVPNLAFTFTGGENGRRIKHILEEEKINSSFVHIKDENRLAAVVIDDSKKQTTTFFCKNNFILQAEAEEFKLRLEKMIQNCEIVVFSGSSPCKETDSIFPSGIEIANKYDKISVLDTYGGHLQSCIDASPTILHNNLNEMETSLSVSLKNEKDKLDFLNSLYAKGIKQVFLTDSGNPAYASNFDYHYKIENPKINLADSTGSGDAFVAGVVYGWYKDLVFKDIVKFAAGLGALNAERLDACRISRDEAESFSERITVSTIGKKMIVVDVTPQK